jgi:hypothetical protein
MINPYLIQSILFLIGIVKRKFLFLLINRETPGKHTAPVWQLYWVEVEKSRDDDTGEVLMSISTGLLLRKFIFSFYYFDLYF